MDAARAVDALRREHGRRRLVQPRVEPFHLRTAALVLRVDVSDVDGTSEGLDGARTP